MFFVGLAQNLKDLKDRWAILGELKPRGPKGQGSKQFPVSAYVGSSGNLKDLKSRRKCVKETKILVPQFSPQGSK